jgi:nickel-dependent lactate racemase
MPETIELHVGLDPWSFTVPPERQVELRRAAIAPPTATAAELARAALEKPFDFEPLRRALTPDDRVMIVLDAALPHVAELLGEVLAHMGTAGVRPEAVTVLTTPGSPSHWVDELADEYAGVQTEVHDPANKAKLAYLATTEAGRRLYMNRTLVEADFIIVLAGRGYDPLTGYAGAEAAVFPALGDDEIRKSVAEQVSVRAPGSEPWEAREEAAEVVRLLGMPFYVQVIEGEGDTVQEVVAGLPPSSGEGVSRQDARWRATVSDEPDTAVAAISGDSARLTFLDLAKAAACAARVVSKGGRIAILTTAAPALGDGARLLRSMTGPTGTRKLLAKLKPDDWAACFLWAFAAKTHSLFLASGYSDNVAEELFATPIHTASEVQRLIDAGSKVLLIPDAHKTMVTTE